MLSHGAMSLLIAAALLATSSTAAEAPNPIRKIVTLLQDMQKEVAAEGEKEKELFDKFMCFCDQGVGGLQKTASEADAQIQDSSAKLEEESSEKSQLEQDVQMHTTDRAQATQDLEKATALRNKESQDNQAQSASQKSSLEALNRAIPALEKNLAASSLVQADADVPQLRKAIQSATALSSAQRQNVLAFMDGTSEEGSPGGSEIVGILKATADEMQKNYADGEVEEQTSAQGFADLKGAKDKEIKLATQALEEKGKRIGNLGVLIVQRQDTMEDATTEKEDALKFASTLDVDCANKKKEWATRSKLRNDEISAISEAIQILNADDALDTFKGAKASTELAQEETTGAFLQSRSKALSPSEKLRKVAAELSATSTKSLSPLRLKLLAFSAQTTMRAALRALAQGKQPSGGVDFGAITKSIDEMINVLEGEMADDSKKKDWCRDELNKAEDEAKDTQEKLDRLSAYMEQTSDEIAELTDEIKSLTDGIANLDKEVSESTQQRKAEHAEYLETNQLTDAAGQLLKKAKNRLVKFYNPAAHVPEETTPAPSFIQKDSHAAVAHRHSKVEPPEAPEVPEGPYKPNKKSGGILKLMDMMSDELAKSLQEAQFAERQAQSDYVALMKESQEKREHDSKSITSKSGSKANLNSKLTDAKENRLGTMKGLDNLHQYNAELHGSCDFLIENFDSRREARANELKGLAAAKATLAGANFGF